MKYEEEIYSSVRNIAIVMTSSISIPGAFVFSAVRRFCFCAAYVTFENSKLIFQPIVVGRMFT